ncbi:NAD(P)-dependent oxidoreductase [Bacteroidetes bacterium SCGC AAA795-G10]|nr:NAD(P)-dependent oxidoreductase [Bacteroidetes bacterium SCGC AAA795-G10]
MENVVLKKKILILGSTGMLGHVLYRTLQAKSNFELFDISFRKKLNDSSIICDVRNVLDLEKKITKIEPSVIINCIGILLRSSKIDPSNTIFINSYLPHRLKNIADKINARIIQVSTDCVFNGNKGFYSEIDIPDARDIYGRSKYLGELDNNRDLTIRTSIIGPELKKNGQGLFSWFLSQKKEIYGYNNVFWGGVTTIILSKAIEKFIQNDNIVGIKHLTNGKKISKYNLLKLFLDFFPKENFKLKKINVDKSDKSLISVRNDDLILVPDYSTMIKEMRDFIKIKGKDFY